MSATATFHNWGGLDALLRDTSISTLEPPFGLDSIFPLPTYVEPTPPLPYTDEADLASDATRPLVFYQITSEPLIRLVKDGGANTVRVER